MLSKGWVVTGAKQGYLAFAIRLPSDSGPAETAEGCDLELLACMLTASSGPTGHSFCGELWSLLCLAKGLASSLAVKFFMCGPCQTSLSMCGPCQTS
jgi:hypothetical protein